MTPTALPYPGPTSENLACLPADLIARPQWVLWRGADCVNQQTGEMKLNKIPMNPHDLTNADTTDPLTWGTFDACVAALPVALEEWETENPAAYRGGGVGYVFAADDPYVGIDLDGCVNSTTGEIADWAQDRMTQLTSYTEITPSGTGLHILVQGTLPPKGRRKDPIEMYNYARFFTMTGWRVPESAPTIEASPGPLAALWCDLFGPTIGHTVWLLDEQGNVTNVDRKPWRILRIEPDPSGEPYAIFAEAATGWPLMRCERAAGVQEQPTPPLFDDATLIDRAQHAANGGKVQRLAAGEWQQDYTSPSEADLALCMLLAFWTQDPAQIDRVFRQWGLMRAKWDEQRGAQTYGQRTIAEALARQTEHYRPKHAAWQQRNGQHPNPASTGDDGPLPYSDYTNALAFVRDHGQDLRYCYPWKSWLVWTGTHWQRDTSGAVMRRAKQTIKHLARQVEELDDIHAKALLAHIKASLSTVKLKALVECAQSEPGIAVQPADLDSHPWLLNCANGTLDLKKGTLRSHAQTDLLTKCLPIAYKKDATCPQWLRFLWRIMGGTQEPDNPKMSIGEPAQRRDADKRAEALINFLQRALGYSLTGSTQEQCFFLLHGPTKTGKSTFLHIAKALLGPYGTQAEMSTFLHKDRDTVRNDLADLAGMRLVCAIETDEGKRLAEALIKQLTGGTDTIKARFLFEEYFEYWPQFKVFLATNHKPKVNANDDAFWERVKLVPFIVQIPPQERDKQLDTKLRQELPGILAWAVRGCLQWQQVKDLQAPPPVVDATQGYRDEMDDVGRFLAEVCVLGDKQTYKTQATTLLKAYHQWCGQTTLTLRALNTALTDRQYESKRFTTGAFWLGIGLPAPEDARWDK
jgi:putative DNA primase/helicase